MSAVLQCPVNLLSELAAPSQTYIPCFGVVVVVAMEQGISFRLVQHLYMFAL